VEGFDGLAGGPGLVVSFASLSAAISAGCAKSTSGHASGIHGEAVR
jgi:hypothetical protein